MATNGSSILIPQVAVQEKHKQLLVDITHYVHAYMSQPGHDNSHDWQHILRVLSNANRLLDAELRTNTTTSYDTSALFLAALLHDVGDHKYAKPGEDTANQIFDALKARGADDHLALKVQTIVKHVSYTHEIRNPEAVISTLQKYPELAVVQDADRLDAIGAIGIARCFSFGAAKSPELPMSRAIDHFGEKLYGLADMMKTQSGRRMAQDRKAILEKFANQYDDESHLSFALN